MIKFVVVTVLALVSSLVYSINQSAQPPTNCEECQFVHVERDMIYVASYASDMLSCYIGSDKFLVRPRRNSELYSRPLGENDYKCNLIKGK